MKKILALGAVLLVALAASCSSTDSKSNQADAGAGGEMAGEPSDSGGSDADAGGAPSTSGGSSTSGGDDAGQAGEGATGGPFTVEGTVQAPTGGDVEGTIVIGCAWIDGDCDEQKSQAVQVSESGESAPYLLENLESGSTYLVLFWKDMNDSGTVDDGDYVGVVADESGAARAFTEAAAGADGIMAVQETVAATDVPEALVGDWFLVAPSIGVTNSWTFAADGSATNSFTLNSAVCGNGAGTATTSQGVISVDGDELTFVPSSGQKTVKPCSGESMTTDYYANSRHFTWRVGPSTTMQDAAALFLTNVQDTSQTEAEFQKL